MHSRWRRFLPKRQTNSHLSADLAVPQPTDSVEADHLLSKLLSQTPRAALAQLEMDKHTHGYHNREKRLYELIDFNDTFVSLVLETPHGQLPGLAERLKAQMKQYCEKLHTPMFTDAQYDAIVRGLSREIAVYRGALHEGFEARMTSRTEDAFGIDMVISDRATGKSSNIDCKTPPAFRHRLEDLVHDGRITEEQLLQADQNLFITTEHRRNEEHIPVTLLCILPDELGEITDFTFSNTVPLGHKLRQIISQS